MPKPSRSVRTATVSTNVLFSYKQHKFPGISTVGTGKPFKDLLTWRYH
jgi:hypothetical protein